MSIPTQPIIQLAIWAGIWTIFIFSGNGDDRPEGYVWLISLRVLTCATYFNLAYYVLLPMYFSGGRKERFIIFSVLAFLSFVVVSALTDMVFLPPRPMFESPPMPDNLPEMSRPHPRPPLLLWVPGIMLGLILFAVAGALRGFSAYEKKKRAAEEANQRRVAAELALLKSQINPHFLLNTLNNLYGISITEPEKTTDALLKLSDMVRYLLYECTQPTVPLVRDLEFVHNYLELQRLRLPSNARLKVELPDSAPEYPIEPMMLIPFIENAFKHGLTTRGPCEIRVAIQIREHQLQLTVENPILPPKSSEDNTPSGIGLTNTRQRLEHSYAEKHQLTISNTEGRHVVSLNMTL